MKSSKNKSKILNKNMMRNLGDVEVYPPTAIKKWERDVTDYAGTPAVVTSQCPGCGRLLTVVGININVDPQGFQAQYVEPKETKIFEGKRDPVYTLGQWFWIIITFGIAYIVYWYGSILTSYRITSQRIIFVDGILFQHQRILELMYVKDFDLEYPLGMRWLGYGILHITTSHSGFADVELYGIKNIDRIYEQLRKAAIVEQRRRSMQLQLWREM